MASKSTFVSKDGKHTIQTSNARERVRLLSQGYRETPAVTEPDQGKPDEGKPDEAASDVPKGRAATAVPKAPAGKSSK